VEVHGITHDSREVKPGDLFVCLVGEKFDGHKFIGDARARGASAFVIDEVHEEAAVDLPTIVVADTRIALPELAAAVHGDPSHDLVAVGVTGTNGKTTTTRLIASILKAAGMKSGTIGTLGAELMGQELPSAHTTPESDQLQALLAEMKRQGAEAVSMEVSSHALVQHRTDATEFDAAVFTNLTQDHLDYHGTMDSYYQAKRRLFTEYADASGKDFCASINVDDTWGKRLAGESLGRIITYGVNSVAGVRAENVRIEPARLAFRAVTDAGAFDAELSIGGSFQVYNALAAIGAAIGLGIAPEKIQRGLADLEAVPGRFESVETGRAFHAIVDYAHTPDGLDNVITAARALNPSRLIVVFGCGGNRDRTKRPIMGRIAGSRADLAIVTSDNPRHEEPGAIIDEVLTGMREASAAVRVEPDRRAAIALALGEAQDGDIVLVAGKGHEDYQIVGDRILPFDDRQVIREILAERGA
jgi:UDP-N-acetylmuramoyl-L-alanyl-D-glutamate--2,6-diaminopimelate ligase